MFDLRPRNNCSCGDFRGVYFVLLLICSWTLSEAQENRPLSSTDQQRLTEAGKNLQRIVDDIPFEFSDAATQRAEELKSSVYEALMVQKNVLGSSHPKTAEAERIRGHLLFIQKKFGAAEARFKRAVELTEQTDPYECFLALQCLRELSEQQHGAGDSKSIEQKQIDLLAQVQETEGPESPRVAALIQYQKHGGLMRLWPRALIADKGTNVYSGQEVIGTIPERSRLTVRKGKGRWLEIQIPGTERFGWIAEWEAATESDDHSAADSAIARNTPARHQESMLKSSSVDNQKSPEPLPGEFTVVETIDSGYQVLTRDGVGVTMAVKPALSASDDGATLTAMAQNGDTLTGLVINRRPDVSPDPDATIQAVLGGIEGLDRTTVKLTTSKKLGLTMQMAVFEAVQSGQRHEGTLQAFWLNQSAWLLVVKQPDQAGPPTIRGIGKEFLDSLRIKVPTNQRSQPNMASSNQSKPARKIKPANQLKLENARALDERAAARNSAGDSKTALELVRQAYDLRVDVLGTDDPASLQSLHNIGVLLQMSGQHGEAELTLTNVLSRRRKILGEDHPDTAASIGQLAVLYSDQKKYADAEPLYRQSLRIREAALGPEESSVIRIVNSLAHNCNEQKKYEDAFELFERVRKFHEDTSGTTSLELAEALDNLADVCTRRLNLEQAETLRRQSLAIYEKVKGPDSAEAADGINFLAINYLDRGLYAAAEEMFTKSLTLRQKLYGNESEKVAESLNNLAAVYQEQDKYDEAIDYHERALKVRQNVLGSQHSLTGVSLNNLATVYMDKADFGKAEELFNQSLNILEQSAGPNHIDTAQTLNNLASIYSKTGRLDKSVPLYHRVLSILESNHGPIHQNVARALLNFGSDLEQQQDFSAARPLYERAISIQTKILGTDHPDHISAYNKLASLANSMGNQAEAEKLSQESLRIAVKSLGDNHSRTANCLHNLGFLLKERNALDQAEDLLLKAVQIHTAANGADHPSTANSLHQLALVNYSQNKIAHAISLIDQERRSQRVHVSRVLPALAAQEQELFLRSHYAASFNKALSLGLTRTGEQETASLSATWLVNGKGVSQEALAQRNLQLRDMDDPQIGSALKELLSIRTRLATLAMNAAAAGKEEQRRTELDRLTNQEQKLSSQLGVNMRTASEWIEISRIRDSLPKDGVLIDIARFDIYDFNAKGRDLKWMPPHYAAWMTFPDVDAQCMLIDLGDAEVIDRLVQKVRQQIAADASTTGRIAKEGEGSAVVALMKDMSALADLIWKPIATHMGHAKQIVLSPDGILWLAPWSALPLNDAGDEYLLERYDLRMVISGRDLVAETDGRPTTPPVILANPAFDQQVAQKESALQAIFKTLPPDREKATRSFSAQSTLPKVQPLPNTGIEALAIQPHIETYTSKKAGVYKEQYALERVAKVLRNPQIVTFATHGFFLPSQETKLADQTLAMSDNTRAVVLDTNGQFIENALLRCGLLLAGCNNREASVADDDGILTGMEIVSIDFRGTELVVLSACETGIGDVKNGEGVAGLRQAFQLAGAEAVVSTLWQIPDRDSALLMSKFFEELATGKSKSESLRNAQLERINKRRERYGAAHPFFWAAFTLTGK
jgi:tetratricopeptide (TPR) repeat protein